MLWQVTGLPADELVSSLQEKKICVQYPIQYQVILSENYTHAALADIFFLQMGKGSAWVQLNKASLILSYHKKCISFLRKLDFRGALDLQKRRGKYKN